jgi:transcriptional regulator with XRE-family HTH domain
MDTVKIGRFISQMRRERGMTQRGFADRLGVSDKTISKWECGGGRAAV